jgi:hypothetical protein
MDLILTEARQAEATLSADAALFARDGRPGWKFCALFFPATDQKTIELFQALSRRERPWLAQEDFTILQEEERSDHFAVAAAGLKSLDAGGRRGMTQRCFRLSELEAVINHSQGRVDHYLAQNSFRAPRRRTTELAGLTSCYLDLDIYKLGLGQEVAAARVAPMCDAWNIPRPWIFSSGRGLYLKWIFDSFLPGAAHGRWHHVQRRLCEIFAPLGADQRALDAARVLRVTGSVNPRSKTVAAVLDDKPARANFDDMANALLPRVRMTPPDRAATRQLQAACQAARLARATRAGGPPASAGRINGPDSWLAGIEADVLALARMRGQAMDGSRELAVHLVMNARRGRGLIKDAADFWRQVAQVGRLVSANSEFLDSLSTAFRRDAGGIFYKYRRATIIERLSLTACELELLPTLNGGGRSLRRNETKAAKGGKRDEARSMRMAGMSFVEIAAALQVSRQTISTWCRDTSTP